MVFNFVKTYLFSKRAGAVVKLISWVSIFGIGISVAAMLVVLNVMNGFNGAIHKRLLSVDPHIYIETNEQQPEAQVLNYLRSEKAFSEADYYPVAEQDIIFRTIDAFFSGAIARGVPSGNLSDMESKVMMQSDLQKDDWQLGNNEVAVGEELARSLGIYLGDELTTIQPESLLLPADQAPKYEKLKVKSIFRSNVSDLDSKYIFYPKDRSMLGFTDSLSERSLVHVFLKNKDDLKAAVSSLNAKGLIHRTWKDKNSSYLYALRLERIAMASFLSLTIIIASFTILMVLSLVISQKKKDIALLKTMGLSSAQTKRLFTLFGFQLGSMGAIGGFLLGLVICWAIEHLGILELPQEIYYDYKIPVEIDYYTSFLILFSALVLSYVASLLPAHLGAKLNISKVLRPGVD